MELIRFQLPHDMIDHTASSIFFIERSRLSVQSKVHACILLLLKSFVQTQGDFDQKLIVAKTIFKMLRSNLQDLKQPGTVQAQYLINDMALLVNHLKGLLEPRVPSDIPVSLIETMHRK